MQLAIIMGEDERAKGEVTVKDLVLGAEMAKAIQSNEEWKSARPAQESVSLEGLIDYLKNYLN